MKQPHGAHMGTEIDRICLQMREMLIQLTRGPRDTSPPIVWLSLVTHDSRRGVLHTRGARDSIVLQGVDYC